MIPIGEVNEIKQRKNTYTTTVQYIFWARFSWYFFMLMTAENAKTSIYLTIL